MLGKKIRNTFINFYPDVSQTIIDKQRVIDEMAEPEINVDHLELLENVNQIGKVDSIFDEIAVNFKHYSILE